MILPFKYIHRCKQSNKIRVKFLTYQIHLSLRPVRRQASFKFIIIQRLTLIRQYLADTGYNNRILRPQYDKQRFADLEVDVFPFATTRIPRCPRNPGNQPYRADINPDHKDVIPHQGKNQHNWTLECQKAFEDLKSSLTASPVLHIFEEDLPCFLYCDASTLGISGILKQKDENGEEHPVQYFSRYLRKYEQNYSISELECLAIIESIEYFRVFWIVFDFYLLKKNYQRTCIIFCVKNEIKCADAFRMLTVAYGEDTLDRSNVYRWYKMFSEGREDVNDEECAGRPSTSTTDGKINEVEKMILANRRITVKEVAEDLNISIGSCHSIFINDLGMRRVAAKFVPKLLNCDQKQHRMNIANEMLDSVRDDPNLLQRVITGDEAWVYGYDVETKAQSSQWKLPHEPRPKKARQVRSNVKVLLTVFFDCRGVVHHEFLPQGRTVNKEYYLQVMRNFREAIRQKRPDLWKNKNWLLHHDNAPAYTSLLVRDFLAKNNTLMMPQPPYFPDLAP
ncbi:hypothetical protein LAZ67_5002912 [Cordylochernes scorpioides]|uniref:Transposase n=1 Tax=Cordylochernes scorpioides TaxID=51811 RepID=A0ABY6KGS8_9ARAC|nr:hypothetical protein LAZ67_5002912 [Cordylochernes scorpioides]